MREGSGCNELTSYIVLSDGCCRIVKGWYYVKVPALGMDVNSGGCMVVELDVDVFFDGLSDNATIVIKDILEPSDWWLRNWWWTGAEIGGVFGYSGADVVSVRVEEGEETVWGHSDWFGDSVFCFFGFGFTLFRELM